LIFFFLSRRTQTPQPSLASPISPYPTSFPSPSAKHSRPPHQTSPLSARAAALDLLHPFLGRAFILAEN